MRIVETTRELRAELAGATDTAFVPTMGNLHAGHIALVEYARRVGAPVVASIFVNPLQFGPGEDYARYPRTFAADCAMLDRAGCDLVFAPGVEELYPEPQTYQVQPPLADELCGTFRPGHFAGVCTVVLKLFNLVRPRHALFGKKDYQQLFILTGMARQFNLDIDIVACDTVRAEDGLALSSRNGYLNAEARREAPRLYAELQAFARALQAGERDFARLEADATARLARHGWHVDYVSLRSRHTLLPPCPGERALIVLAAARLDGTRLIDNIEIDLDAGIDLQPPAASRP